MTRTTERRNVMRNIERYPGTKEAIKAWDAYHDGGG